MMTTQRVRADRFDQWLQQVNQACGCFAAKPLGEAFAGSLSEYRSGAIKLSFVDVAQARLFRGNRELADSEGDHYYACFQLQGQADMAQDGNHAKLDAGDIVLIDAGRPSSFVYGDGSRQLSLILPRRLVEQHLHYSAVRCGQRIAGSSPLALMANRLVVESTRQACLSLAESEATLAALVSLLRPAITGTDLGHHPHESTFRKAIAYIDEHIREDDLCPELLAKEIGVSVRGLYRMFAKKDLVIAQYIKHRRLDFCAESLRQSGGEQKLSAIGYAWGFSDSSRFSTAFKSRFGLSPGEYRKRHQD
ncbi:transcriptional regulator FeaR [Pseudomonas sp. LRF_L74]|uniref:transcriptional regulator FeaR n=1 Tax=Pseudomonas sp. LRF_L74 TaxID=3369422 RepID=UPI003F638B05